MKAFRCCRRLLFVSACFTFFQSALAQPTGRVVINEYMPWTSNGCGVTAEFVELLNLGPGPVDLSCYILTTGTYSITLPPATVLAPGDFYVLSGQDFIPGSCANIDSATTGIRANLNWNTCGCTNVPIPTTGDGMMTDGGSSNTPLVLLDPSLNVIDAVVRSLPAEPPTLVNASTVSGRCGRRTFDLSLMPVVYEDLGMSAGRGNSFARTIDGDCRWLKEPQQSGNASNNRSGDATDIDYQFSLIRALNCNGQGGRASIYVNHTNYAAVFPMYYTVAFDANGNGSFDMDDVYNTYVDSTAPEIDVSGLATGRYRITVSSAKGCYLETFEFLIADCSVTLPVRLELFTYAGRVNNSQLLQWKLHSIETLEKVIVQKAYTAGQFSDDRSFEEPVGASGTKNYAVEIAGSNYSFFRLKIVTKDRKEFFSAVISATPFTAFNKVWPNPVTDVLNVQLNSAAAKKAQYAVYNSSGRTVDKGELTLQKGQNIYALAVAQLSPGMHQLRITGLSEDGQPISFRFVKH